MSLAKELAERYARGVDSDYDVTTVTLETMVKDAIDEAIERCALEILKAPMNIHGAMWTLLERESMAERIRALKSTYLVIP